MPSLTEILNSKIGKDLVSKASVAELLKVSERTIENYMKGERKPKPDALIKLSKFLKFSLDDLTEQNVPHETPSARQQTPTMNQQGDLQERIKALEKDKVFLQETVQSLLKSNESIQKLLANSERSLQNQKVFLAKQEGAIKVMVESFAGNDNKKVDQALHRVRTYAAKFQEADGEG